METKTSKVTRYCADVFLARWSICGFCVGSMMAPTRKPRSGANDRYKPEFIRGHCAVELLGVEQQIGVGVELCVVCAPHQHRAGHLAQVAMLVLMSLRSGTWRIKVKCIGGITKGISMRLLEVFSTFCKVKRMVLKVIFQGRLAAV